MDPQITQIAQISSESSDGLLPYRVYSAGCWNASVFAQAAPKRVQRQGAGAAIPHGWVPAEARGVLSTYWRSVAPIGTMGTRRGNAAGGPFSAAC